MYQQPRPELIDHFINMKNEFRGKEDGLKIEYPNINMKLYSFPHYLIKCGNHEWAEYVMFNQAFK